MLNLGEKNRNIANLNGPVIKLIHSSAIKVDLILCLEVKEFPSIADYVCV